MASQKKAVVIYSLGNFISSQRSTYNNGDDTDIGMIFEVGISRVDHHRPYISDVGYMTTYNHWSAEAVRVISTLEVPEAIELTDYDKHQIDHANTFITDHIGSYMDYEPILENGYYRYYFE